MDFLEKILELTIQVRKSQMEVILPRGKSSVLEIFWGVPVWGGVGWKACVMHI